MFIKTVEIFATLCVCKYLSCRVPGFLCLLILKFGAVLRVVLRVAEIHYCMERLLWYVILWSNLLKVCQAR